MLQRIRRLLGPLRDRGDGSPHHPPERTPEELIEQYRQLRQLKGRYGIMSESLLGLIQDALEEILPVESILDYGCGNSRTVDWLAKINDINGFRYDPAIPEYSRLPVAKADVVINTDVLEHVLECDLDHVLAEIRSISDRVYFHIATQPANSILPNGDNAHCTVRPAEWWQKKLAYYFGEARELPAKYKKRCAFVTWPAPRKES